MIELKSKVNPIKSITTGSEGRVGLIDQTQAGEIVELAFRQGYNHVVHAGQPETGRELRASRVMSQRPELFLNFPLSVVFKPRQAGPVAEQALALREWALISYPHKASIIQEIGRAFQELKIDDSLRDDVIFTADEFMCNVLFNAIRPSGINQHDFRATMAMANRPLHEPAILRLGIGNGFLALTCRDAYGTLDPMRLLGRLDACFSQGAGTAINLLDRGTAGIGSFLVFNMCSSFYIGVKPGVATQVCAVYPLRLGARKRAIRGKNLHWVQCGR